MRKNPVIRIIKKFRLYNARKCSRSDTNEDVFRTLLYTSDPYINSIRKPYNKNLQELDEDTLHFLKVNELISGTESPYVVMI